MNKYTRLFIDESREYLPAIGDVLARLRAGGASAEDLKEGHRLAHSIKGMALYEEQAAIAALSWAMERGFERLREDIPRDGLAPALEGALPLLAALVDEVEEAGATRTDPEGAVAAIEAVIGPG